MTGSEDAPISFQRILNKAAGPSLIAAAVCLIIQLRLLADSPAAIRAVQQSFLYSLLSSLRDRKLQAIPAISSNYEIFVSVVIVADLFVILAFGIWYFLLREKSPVAALGAFLTGVIALALQLTMDLSIQSSRISFSGTSYQLVLDVSNNAFLISTFMLGVSFLFLGYAMLKARSLFGSLISYLASLAGILLVALVPLPFSSNTTGFLIIYTSSIVVQVAFFVLTGRKMYLMLAMPKNTVNKQRVIVNS